MDVICRFYRRVGGLMASTNLGLEHLGPCESYGLSPHGTTLDDLSMMQWAAKRQILCEIHPTGIRSIDLFLDRLITG